MPRVRRPLQSKARRQISKRIYKSQSKKSVHKSRSKLRHKIDINTCSKTSMRQLKVPSSAVDSIMQYRRKFKCFTHINELLRIKAIDTDIFRILNSNYKVEKSVDELRDTLQSRRRKSVIISKSSTSQYRTHRSKSNPICDRLPAKRCNSSHSGLSRSASAMSARSASTKGSQNSGRKAAVSRSMASILSGLWSRSNDIEEKSRPARRPRRQTANNRRAGTPLSKVGSDILSSLSSAFYESEKRTRPAEGSNSSTARWVTDVQQRSANKASDRQLGRNRSTRYIDRDRVDRRYRSPSTSHSAPQICHKEKVLRGHGIRARDPDRGQKESCIVM